MLRKNPNPTRGLLWKTLDFSGLAQLFRTVGTHSDPFLMLLREQPGMLFTALDNAA
jgi:hypothetical protein